MVLTDRIIPFLAAGVGLVALAGAVLVQVNADARTKQMAGEMAGLRATIEQLTDQAKAAVAPANDGAIDAMLALQDRMNRLEAAWDERPTQTAAAPGSGGGIANAFATSLGGQPAAVDPSWPTTDCIPMGTRFMASLGDEMAICETPVKVKISAITDDNVLVDGTGVITETAFRSLAGTNCTLTVFSADAAGFAEMRVSCL
ncbi:MAG TPA: hypothetical protein PK286_07745 [Devosia sp.]|nr:hypothetical protein [Devosia sp.]